MSAAPSRTRRFVGFPDVVDERAARTVAAGVVVMSSAYVVTGWRWIVALLAFGFVARVVAGPRYSPLALLATRVVVPRLRGYARLTPGPPKRFAQAIGATLSVSALVLSVVMDSSAASRVLVAAVTVAASLEAALGFCLGCTVFAGLMRLGVIPERVCEACSDLSRRPAAA